MRHRMTDHRDPRDPLTFIQRHTDVSYPARVRQGQIHNLRLQIIPAEMILPSGEVVPVAKPHAHDADDKAEGAQADKKEEDSDRQDHRKYRRRKPRYLGADPGRDDHPNRGEVASGELPPPR